MPFSASSLRRQFLSVLTLALAGFGLWQLLAPRAPAPEQVAAAYADPLARPEAPLNVFHLGHSLVGRDMPAMLAQLAGEGHTHNSQLGWGTSLRQHWEPDEPINGFETENATDAYRDAAEAIGSGTYDAIVLTEMVELRDAIKYHDSARYLSLWAEKAREANPSARVYLYETWHRLDDSDGWLERIDDDLPQLWEERLLIPHLARTGGPVHVIPAGQVLASFVRAIESAGGVGGMSDRTDLFARAQTGAVDQIHLNDLGAYLVALTHYAVLYHRSPVGLPHALRRADGSEANAPSPEAARLMQDTVWQVVTSYPKTGVAP